jgi:hypothetical protein
MPKISDSTLPIFGPTCSFRNYFNRPIIKISRFGDMKIRSYDPYPTIVGSSHYVGLQYPLFWLEDTGGLRNAGCLHLWNITSLFKVSTHNGCYCCCYVLLHVVKIWTEGCVNVWNYLINDRFIIIFKYAWRWCSSK